MTQKITSEEKKYLEHRNIEIIGQFKRGVSIESLCDLFDLSEQEINEIVRKSVKKPTKQRIDFRTTPVGKLDRLLSRIKNYCRAGKNSKQISDILQISQKDIREIIREFDIKIYVECKHCGELTDRTKRGWRHYCNNCGHQLKIGYNAQWNRKKYRENQQHREKVKEKTRNHTLFTKKLVEEAMRNP